jgi:hypothetical protein
VTRTSTSSSPSTAVRRGRTDAPRIDTGTVRSLGRGGAGLRCRPSPPFSRLPRSSPSQPARPPGAGALGPAAARDRDVEAGASRSAPRADSTCRRSGSRSGCRGGAASSTSSRAGTHPSRSSPGGAPDTATRRRAARRSGGGWSVRRRDIRARYGSHASRSAAVDRAVDVGTHGLPVWTTISRAGSLETSRRTRVSCGAGAATRGCCARAGPRRVAPRPAPTPAPGARAPAAGRSPPTGPTPPPPRGTPRRPIGSARG